MMSFFGSNNEIKISGTMNKSLRKCFGKYFFFIISIETITIKRTHQECC